MQQNTISHFRDRLLAPLEETTLDFCKSEDCERILLSCFENAIPSFGDWCVVELCTEDKSLRDPVIIHRNFEELTRVGAENISNLNYLWEKDSDYSSCEEGSFLHRLAKNDEQFSVLSSLNLTSYVSVPLISPVHLWGWVTIFSVQSPPGVEPKDLSKVKALASCAACALDQAAEKFKADQAIELKDKSISMISHELRAPLNVTLGWSALLLEDENLNKETKDALEIIYRNTREMTDIVANLFDSARIELGKLALDCKEIHLSTFVKQGVQAFQVLARDKGVKLSCDIKSTFAKITGDSIRLHQILQNLIVNAIKFTPKNGNILVSLKEDSKNVVIEVQDDGDGISKEFLPQVFDRFKQNLGKKSYQPGLGLGLSIVRDLVKAHGGEVGAFSDGPGRGSTFSVKFPKNDSGCSSQAALIH